MLQLVSSKEIDEIAEAIKHTRETTVPGTMSIHQIVVPTHGSLHHRELSCYKCDPIQICKCHKPACVNMRIDNRKEFDKVLRGIECRLDESLQSLFEERFENGYDVTIEDLSSLSPAKRQEYIYWTAWRAAKLRDKSVKENEDEYEDI